MAKTSFNQQKAYDLYHAYKTDAEMAEVLGVPDTTIRSWRNRKGLVNISPNARNGRKYRKKVLYPGESGGVHYRKALNPAQAKVMSRFLTALSYAGRECAEAGIKPDVGRAINAFSGREVRSYAERTTAARYQQRERRANGK